MIELRMIPAPWRTEEGVPDECLLACVDEDELLATIDEVVDRAQREQDADTLISIARRLTYNEMPEAAWKHRLLEIAGRLL